MTIHISGSNSLTNSKNPIKVAELADGSVYLTHMYGQDEIVWTTVDVSVTFAA